MEWFDLDALGVMRYGQGIALMPTYEVRAGSVVVGSVSKRAGTDTDPTTFCATTVRGNEAYVEPSLEACLKWLMSKAGLSPQPLGPGRPLPSDPDDPVSGTRLDA
jgi:hypothetical protein